MQKALFEGLVSDENGNQARVVYVGEEPTYVVTEDGFDYHVDARHVDEQVLDFFRAQVQGNQGAVSDGMLKMIGKDDLFTKAAVDNSLRNVDRTFAQLAQQGIPEQGRIYLGMLGFKVVINRHGDIIKLDMPSEINNLGEE